MDQATTFSLLFHVDDEEQRAWLREGYEGLNKERLGFRMTLMNRVPIAVFLPAHDDHGEPGHLAEFLQNFFERFGDRKDNNIIYWRSVDSEDVERFGKIIVTSKSIRQKQSTPEEYQGRGSRGTRHLGNPLLQVGTGGGLIGAGMLHGAKGKHKEA